MEVVVYFEANQSVKSIMKLQKTWHTATGVFEELGDTAVILSTPPPAYIYNTLNTKYTASINQQVVAQSAVSAVGLPLL